MAGFLIRWSMCSALALIAAPAMAQRVMADPTRPPGNVVMDSQAAVDVSGPVLQSVLIPKKGRPVAVIGGQQVRLGEKYGESRLVRLSEREAAKHAQWLVKDAYGNRRAVFYDLIQEKQNHIPYRK